MARTARSGRKPRFAANSVPRTVFLPKAVWDELDKFKGSRTEAFLAMILSDRGVQRLRHILEQSLPK